MDIEVRQSKCELRDQHQSAMKYKELCLHGILQGINPLFALRFRFHIQRERRRLCLAGQQQLELEARIFAQRFAAERRLDAVVGQIVRLAE